MKKWTQKTKLYIKYYIFAIKFSLPVMRISISHFTMFCEGCCSLFKYTGRYTNNGSSFCYIHFIVDAIFCAFKLIICIRVIETLFLFHNDEISVYDCLFFLPKTDFQIMEKLLLRLTSQSAASFMVYGCCCCCCCCNSRSGYGIL